MVRVDPEIASEWADVAQAKGVPVNALIVDATNAWLSTGLTGEFTATGAPATTVSTSVPDQTPDPLLAFDLALTTTPTLTGARKWVDSDVLRQEFVRLLKS